MPFTKGHKLNIGRKHSPETIQKMALVKIGNKYSLGTKKSPEECLMISKRFLGKKQTEEHRRNSSLARMGKPSWNKGIPFSAKTKALWSKIRKGKPSWNKGIPSYKTRGVNNSQWKGGITPLLAQIRSCLKYNLWRSSCMVRDNYTCQLCGKRGGELNVDHYPKRFSQIFHDNKIKSLEEAEACEELWDINNGRTLCYPCHYLWTFGKKITLKKHETVSSTN